jgi:hypothetical protein
MAYSGDGNPYYTSGLLEEHPHQRIPRAAAQKREANAYIEEVTGEKDGDWESGDDAGVLSGDDYISESDMDASDEEADHEFGSASDEVKISILEERSRRDVVHRLEAEMKSLKRAKHKMEMDDITEPIEYYIPNEPVEDNTNDEPGIGLSDTEEDGATGEVGLDAASVLLNTPLQPASQEQIVQFTAYLNAVEGRFELLFTRGLKRYDELYKDQEDTRKRLYKIIDPVINLGNPDFDEPDLDTPKEPQFSDSELEKIKSLCDEMQGLVKVLADRGPILNRMLIETENELEACHVMSCEFDVGEKAKLHMNEVIEIFKNIDKDYGHLFHEIEDVRAADVIESVSPAHVVQIRREELARINEKEDLIVQRFKDKADREARAVNREQMNSDPERMARHEQQLRSYEHRNIARRGANRGFREIRGCEDPEWTPAQDLYYEEEQLERYNDILAEYKPADLVADRVRGKRKVVTPLHKETRPTMGNTFRPIYAPGGARGFRRYYAGPDKNARRAKIPPLHDVKPPAPINGKSVDTTPVERHGSVLETVNHDHGNAGASPTRATYLPLPAVGTTHFAARPSKPRPDITKYKGDTAKYMRALAQWLIWRKGGIESDIRKLTGLISVSRDQISVILGWLRSSAEIERAVSTVRVKMEEYKKLLKENQSLLKVIAGQMKSNESRMRQGSTSELYDRIVDEVTSHVHNHIIGEVD